MKRIYLLLILFIVTFISLQKASGQQAYVSFQVFYDELSPYGTWVDNPDYGYVWLPNVEPGFVPYATNGYWLLTDDGWTWVSNYSWGWAPFHYGRWYTDANYGPMWIPDYEWGPAWVTWRRSSGYYGWAPIGPGISISIAFGSGYNERYNHYTFVEDRYFGRRNMHKHYMRYSDHDRNFNNSTMINNIREDKRSNVRYHGGPDRADVEKRVGRKITAIPIKESNKPSQSVNKKQLQIYRPQVQKNISNGPKPVPSKVVSLKDVKTSAQRSSETTPQKAKQSGKLQPLKPQNNTQPTKLAPLQTPQTNPSKKGEKVKQPQQMNPPKRVEGNKQPSKLAPAQVPQANPSKKLERVKQPQQINQPKKVDGTKQLQPSSPQKNKGRVKQQQPNVQQPKQRQSQPKQANPRKAEVVKQPQPNIQQPKQAPSQPRQANPPRKVEVVKQPQQARPPQNRGEGKPPR